MEDNTILEKESQVRSQVNKVAHLRRDISSECLKLYEMNLKQELGNAEKLVILKAKTDAGTHECMTSLNKTLGTYYTPEPNQATINDAFSMIDKLREKNDDIKQVTSMLPKKFT